MRFLLISYLENYDLVLHEMEEPILQKSIAEARRAGYLQNRKIRVALDTTPILGKGAVKDTYNLLGEGIEMLGRRLAEVEKEEVTAWAEKQGLSRYFGSSLKGEAGIDWDDKGQREQLLTEIVQEGRRLLSLAEEIQKQHPAQAEAIAAAAALLLRLIAQDVEEKPGGGFQVKSGTAKGLHCRRQWRRGHKLSPNAGGSHAHCFNSLFPPRLVVDILSHVNVGVSHVVPRHLRPNASTAHQA